MKTTFELVMVLIDTGFSDVVMKAAIEEGARGGTIIHARGTASTTVEKTYGIAVTPDKELVMILLRTEIKDQVMSAIFKVAGTDTPAHGFVFSLPATNVVGLKFDSEENE